MNLTGLLSASMLDSSQRVLIQIVIPLWYCSKGNRSKTALRACSSAALEELSSHRLVFLLSSDDPGPWDPRPSGRGAITMSEYIPRSCRARSTGDGRCIRFQHGNTGCKAANHLFDFVFFFASCVATVCERKRLDAIIESGCALHE